jgi:hypothetical protein
MVENVSRFLVGKRKTFCDLPHKIIATGQPVALVVHDG